MHSDKRKAGKHPEYVIRLRVDPMGQYVPDGYARLRRALKCLGRSFGLFTVSVIPAPESPDIAQAEIDRRARYAKWTAEVRKFLLDGGLLKDDTAVVGAADDATDNGLNTRNGDSESCKTRH
jgi:hypothetical protein